MSKLLRYLVICYLLSTPYCLPLYSYPQGWSDDILITIDSIGDTPDIDVDSHNNVWITWYIATWTDGEVYYSKRDSLGNCLIPETSVSNNASKSYLSRIAVDKSDNVQFIWRDASPQGDGVWHAKLANDGSVLVPPHLAVSGSGGYSLIPGIALDKYKNINIICDGTTSGYYKMYYSKLDSLGNPIIDKLQVSTDNVNVYWPGIGVDSLGNSHMAYRTDTAGIAYRLTYTKIDQDGNIVISNKNLWFGGNPTLIADPSQNIHMVYTDPTESSNRIKYLKLDQQGNVILSPRTISLPGTESNTYVHMAMDSLYYLHVVWQASEMSYNRIMYAKLDTLGDTLISPVEIVGIPHTTLAGEPRIAVDLSNRLHVTWMDGRLNPGETLDIFYKRGENEQSIGETEQSMRPYYGISACPNPFCRTTIIHFSGHYSDESTVISIFDVTGSVVQEFTLGKSSDAVEWCGEDNLGNQLPPGIYFVCTKDDWYSKMIKLVKL
ncbi:MAG: T9SS type A sorting domain-containing protein [bacterium]